VRQPTILVLVGVTLVSESLALAQAMSPRGANPSDDADSVTEIDVVASRPAASLQNKVDALDQSRNSFLLPKLGATAYPIGPEAIQSLPQGENTPIDKVILQAPGVSYDSAISNPDFHIRGEYSNVQYRLNGIPLPQGISGLGPVLETGFIGGLTLLDGALPAQYGLRTAGVIDITTKNAFDTGGSIGVYGGTLGTVSPLLLTPPRRARPRIVWLISRTGRYQAPRCDWPWRC
jgi:hypothetical protein